MPTLPGETSVIPSARDLAVARAVQTAEERQGFYRLEDVIAAIPEPDPLPACQSCDLGDKWAECSCTDRVPQPPVTRSDLAAVGAALANLRPPDPLPAPTGPGCAWTEDGDGSWWSACGDGFVFTDGGPQDNSFRFCCYCGLPLVPPRGGE